MMPDKQRYSIIAIGLHWLIAIMIIGQLAGGMLMVNLSVEQGALKFELFQWHKSFGVTIFILSVVRLLWRLTHKPPGLPNNMNRFEVFAANFTHLAFYGFMLTIPLIGWAVVSVSPYAASVPTYLFGVIPWPHLPFFEHVAEREEITTLLADAHKFMGWAMIALLILHIGAALKHHFINGDNVLSRMLPLLKAK